jgi:uncharacterized RDD family membrane protein YckC
VFPEIVTCPSCQTLIRLETEEQFLQEIPCPACSQPIRRSHIIDLSWVEYGKFWRRVGARLFDSLLFSPIIVASFFAAVLINPWLYLPIEFFATILFLAYLVVCHAWFGASIGKRLFWISVRRPDLEPIGWKEAMKRNAIDFAMLFVWGLGRFIAMFSMPHYAIVKADLVAVDALMRIYVKQPFKILEFAYLVWIVADTVVMAFHPRNRALHDLLADSVVVLKRSLVDHSKLSPSARVPR